MLGRHSGVGVEQLAFGRVQDVLRDEAPACDFPQAPAFGQCGHGLGLDAGEAEKRSGGGELVGFLAVDDAG